MLALQTQWSDFFPKWAFQAQERKRKGLFRRLWQELAALEALRRLESPFSLLAGLLQSASLKWLRLSPPPKSWEALERALPLKLREKWDLALLPNWALVLLEELLAQNPCHNQEFRLLRHQKQRKKRLTAV